MDTNEHINAAKIIGSVPVNIDHWNIVAYRRNSDGQRTMAVLVDEFSIIGVDFDGKPVVTYAVEPWQVSRIVGEKFLADEAKKSSAIVDATKIAMTIYDAHGRLEALKYLRDRLRHSGFGLSDCHNLINNAIEMRTAEERKSDLECVKTDIRKNIAEHGSVSLGDILQVALSNRIKD